MKILQLSKYYPPTFGGLEIVAEFFSRAFIDLGHKVHVLSVSSMDKVYQGQFGETVVQSKENMNLKSTPFSLGYFQAVKKEISQNTPQIMLIHLPNPFAHEILKWNTDLIKQKKIKVIGIYHSDIINQATLRDAYNFFFSQHQDLYDYFICSSPDLKVSSSILGPLKDEKVKIIPFCIDHEYKHFSGTRTKSFKGKFLTVGRMVPYKGYEFLIESFQSLPYELTFIGGGPLKNRLQKMAPSHVKFLGEVSEEEKYALFHEHDALIMSSINRAEAYGMTIVEAFSVGLPVIASDIDTGVSFLVKNKETGLKFPILDKESLIEQIQTFASDPHLVQSLSQNALDTFNQKLNYPAFRKNIQNLISEL